MQFKAITAIIVLLLMVASLSVAGCTISPTSTSSPTPTPTPSINLVRYVNAANGFSVSFPQGWEKLERKPTPDDHAAVIFYLPTSSESEQVYVSTTPANGADLNKVTEINRDSAQGLADNKTIDVIESRETTLAGQTAYKLVYDINAVGVRSMQIWTVKNDTVYTFNYNAQTQHYNDYLTTVQQMVDSFKFTS